MIEPAYTDDPNYRVLYGDTSDTMLESDYPPLEQICGPLTNQSITMISAHAGVGKSLWTLSMCAHIAAGEDFESWKVPRPRGVLYFDGELTPWQLQSRLKINPPSDRLHIVHRDYLAKHGYPNFNVGDWYHQDWISCERTLAAFDVVVFDTTTALLHPREEQSVFHPDYWLQVLDMNTRLKNAGLAVIWVDHLNKQNETYGTSAKKWTCDNEWLFEKLEDMPPAATAGFDIEVGKSRNLPEHGTAESRWLCGLTYGWKIET